MKYSSLLVEFNVEDLSATYELYGTSKNYSFRQTLGRGINLVDNEGEGYSTVVDLKGNYGDFEVRVYCVSEIGIKSESLIGTISVNPPGFQGTFTLNNLRIDSIVPGIQESLTITTAPENFGDPLVSSQIFQNKGLEIFWEVLPPGGHPREGESLTNDIIQDPFFSHFEIKVYEGSNLLDLSSSLFMQRAIGSTNVQSLLNYYTDFNLNIPLEVFDELNIGRDISIHIDCVDSNGDRATGVLNLTNPYVDISNLTHTLNGNTVEFSWASEDFDYRASEVRYLAVSDKYNIYDSSSFDASLQYYRDINNADEWSDQIEYSSGDFVLYEGGVYESQADHISSSIFLADIELWNKIFDEVPRYFTETVDVQGSTFSNNQLWGYNYYYAIKPRDDFGPSSEKYVSDGGNFGTVLAPFLCKISIDNFRGMEQGDSFLFNWDFVDAFGEKTDLNQYRYSFNNQDMPSILGVAGYLYDVDSGEILKSISSEVVSKTLEVNEDGNLSIDYKKSNAGVFNSYEYTRAINNNLYGTAYGAEGGKRSIGLELSLVDNQLNVINSPLKVEVTNPAPRILSAGFLQGVDSISEASKVKFNFNYAIGAQEKTTKVYLYRIADHEVETYDEDGNILSKDFSSFSHLDENGLPDTRTFAQGGHFVQKIEGPGDATYGENITQIVDIPPEDKSIEGYYYKILPFDDFGSGVLFNVPYGEGDPSQTLQKVIVYPRNLSSNDPIAPPGKVMREDPTFSAGAVPGPVVGFNGNTSFENYFLNWGAPQSDFDPNSEEGTLLTWTENDIDHYEVWMSDENYLKLNGEAWSAAENTGYRRVDGVAYSVGDIIPREISDPAKNISNAKNIFNMPANAPSIEVSYPGKTRETKSFWIRAVDFAGNKSSFTDSDSNQNSIQGLTLTLGTATATDIDDFEISMTSGFADSIALVPNNPFKDGSDGEISWDEHILYNDGTGYIVNAGSTSDGYVWWDRNDSSNNLNLTSYNVRVNGVEQPYFGQAEGVLQEFNYNDDPWEGVKNVYFKGLEYKTSDTHPSNNPEQDQAFSSDPDANQNSISLTVAGFDDGDFVIARNTNGIVTPVHQSFANALIGTANIAEAAIKTAHIHDLSADKITAGQIKGHRIEVFNQGDGILTPIEQYGSIGSTDFTDLVFEGGTTLLDVNTKGFVLNGDGTFAFQQGRNSLSFEQGELLLRGRMKQKNNKDYDFIEINPSPRYFSYIENDEGFQPVDGFDAVGSDGISDEVARLKITFRNSSISGAEDIQVKAVRLLHDGSEENIFVVANDEDPNVTDDGWLAVTELSAYKDDYGFRWANDYVAAFDEGPGVFSTSVLLPVYADNDRASYHSLVQTSPEVYQDTIILYARSIHSDIRKECIITRLVDGKASESIRLSANSQIFKLKKDFTCDLSEITISASVQGNNQRLRWESTNNIPLYNQNNNVISQGENDWGSYQQVKVKFSDFVNVNSTPKSIKQALSTIKVISEQGSDLYGNVTSPEMSDEISIFVLEEGSDAITAILSNENHNFHLKERYEYLKDGGVETPQTGEEYDGSGTDIQVWEGVSPLVFTSNSTLNAGQFTVSAASSKQNGSDEITPGTISSVDGYGGIARVADHKNLLEGALNINIDYTISGRTFSGKSFTITKTQTLSVSRDGSTSKSLSIHSDSYIFSKNKDLDGFASLSPEWIEVSAESKNISENIIWSHNGSGNLFRSSFSDTTASAQLTVSANQSAYIKRDDFWNLALNEVKITATSIRENTVGGASNFTVSDSVTISRVDEGSNTVQAVLSNESHSLPEINESGTFEYSGSGTDLFVYDGSQRLQPTTSSSLASGQFKVTERVVSPSLGLTYGAQTAIGTDSNSWGYRYAKVSAMPATVFSSTITYNISFKKYSGETGTTSITQTISKSIAGTSVDIVFARGATAPTITANGANTPSGWYTDADDINLQGNNKGFLWASRGEKRAGETAYTWKAPFRVEGEVVAEVKLYKKVAYNEAEGGAPTSTYSFAENKVNINTVDANNGWQKNIPSVENNSDSIFESVALFSGPQNQTNATSVWSAPAKTSFKLDGQRVEYWFQASTNENTPPAISSSIAASPGENWKDDISQAQGTGFIWVVKGVSVLGRPDLVYNFSGAYRLEANAVAEPRLYHKDVNSTLINDIVVPTSTYDFTRNQVVLSAADTGVWSASVPEVSTDNDVIYESVGLFSGPKNQANQAGTWSAPSKIAHKLDGQRVEYWFQKDPSEDTAPTVNQNGSSNPGNNWKNDISAAGGIGFTWVVKGVSRLGSAGSVYDFGTPYRLEANAVAEVKLYKKVANFGSGGDAPTSTYDFTENQVVFSTADTGVWSTSVPNLQQNNDVIYESSAIFSGPKNQTNQAASGSGWSTPSKIAHKLDGQRVEYWFQSSGSATTPPDVSTTAASSPGNNWENDIGSSQNNVGYMWVVKGVSVSGATTDIYNFGAPFRLEGDVAAEVIVYKKVSKDTNLGDDDTPQNAHYNFSNNSFYPGENGWDVNIPSEQGLSNGEKIYASSAIFSSYKGDANAGATWSAPWIVAKRKDGVATSFRGEWNQNEQYVGNSFRGDVVKYNDGTTTSYYICIEDQPSSDTEAPNISDKWEPFGQQFDSVATGLLLTEVGYVTEKLEIGEGGVGGALRSPGFKGGLFDADTKELITVNNYSTSGYLLATNYSGDSTNVFFDVGGINPYTEDLSYIRYSSLAGKVEIKGTFINNSVESTVVSSGSSINQSLEEYINSLQGTQDFDNIAYFIGGGYNNTFNNTGYEADNIASSIVGGAQNLMSSHFSSIVGGYENQCRDNFSVIGGGWINTMSAVEEGNRQGANGILSGIKNNINGGSNQTIINGVDNKIEQTSIGDQNKGGGGVKLDIINAITGPRYFGIPDRDPPVYAVFSAESDSWIYSSWFPGYEVDNFSDYFFISSPTHEDQWIFSMEFGWTFINWKTPTSMKTYLPAGSDIALNIYTQWEDGLAGWWIITKPVSETFLLNSPNYLTMYKDGVGWYFVRRTADNKTQAWQSSGVSAWSAGTAYNVGDLVHWGGYRWECQTDHTSSSSTYPTSSSSIWTNIGNSWQTAKSN